MPQLDTQLSHPKYRPDIDGLRAIAVLSVVAFHAFPMWMKGGFIGVDIFFVISGFLISTIVFENLEQGTFNFVEFYARRIKRIFPALLIVLAACYALGWFALLADEYKQLGKHIAAGTTFVSNFLLWNEAGYFDNAAQTKPLLHLWSLGIEEQFYLTWPFLVWLACRHNFGVAKAMLLICMASFGANIYLAAHDAVAAFYSPQARFWELLSGGLLAWVSLHKKGAFVSFGMKPDGGVANALARFSLKDGTESASIVAPNVVSSIGLLLLAYGFLQLSTNFSFPGKWALVPVAGAVMIISAGNRAWLNRTVLANRVVVWFGLISFPLYLWHWPLLSFARIVENQEPSRNIRIAAVVISIFLAWVTYELIERPVRFGGNNPAKIAALALLMGTVGFVGYDTYERDGLAFRKYATLKAASGDIGHGEFMRYLSTHYFLCTPDAIAREALQYEGIVRCRQSKEGDNVNIALVGDSHAEHLFPGIADSLPDKNVAFYIKGGTPFISNPAFTDIFNFIIRSKTITVVVLTMYWNFEIYGSASSALENELLKTADALLMAGKRLYLVEDVPAFPFGPAKCGRRWLSPDRVCDMDETHAKAQSELYLSSLHDIIKKRPQILLFDVDRYFCDNGVCSMAIGDKLLYRDENHLNIIGSLYIGRRLVEDHARDFD